MEAAQAEEKRLENAVVAAKELDKQATAMDALAKAQKVFAGSSEEFGKTAAGAHERFAVAVENLQEKIGGALLPAITDLTNAGIKAVEWLEDNEKAAKVLVIGIGALTTALIAAKVAQLLLNLAVLANPYVAVAVLVAALAAGIFFLYQKFEQARPAIILFTAVFSPLAAAILLVKNYGDDLIDVLEWFRDKAGPAVTKFKDAALIALTPLLTGFRQILTVVNGIKNAIEWLIKHIPDIPSPPKFSLPDLNPFNGDPRDPTGTGPTSIHSSLWDELGSARAAGLTLTSGYRPGAITANGTPSDHGRFPSRAIDVAGAAASMARFFMSLVGNRGVKQAFYDPLGSIFGGMRSSYREGGHSDHVHVATYDKGGYLKPGWNLAYNGLGRPEPVGAGAMGGPQSITVNLGGTTIARLVKNAKGRYEQLNGPGSF